MTRPHFSQKKIAIVGSRKWNDPGKVEAQVKEYVRNLSPNSILISGGAPGVDTWAEEAGRERNMQMKIYLAKWKEYGRKAGMIRNRGIVIACDELVAFWDGKSPGTKRSIDLAQAEGKLKEVFVI